LDVRRELHHLLRARVYPGSPLVG